MKGWTDAHLPQNRTKTAEVVSEVAKEKKVSPSRSQAAITKPADNVEYSSDTDAQREGFFADMIERLYKMEEVAQVRQVRDNALEVTRGKWTYVVTVELKR